MPLVGFFCFWNPFFVISFYFSRTSFFFFIVLVCSFVLTVQHTTQTSMPPARFKPAFPASQRPQILALDHSAIRTGSKPEPFSPQPSHYTNWATPTVTAHNRSHRPFRVFLSFVSQRYVTDAVSKHEASSTIRAQTVKTRSTWTKTFCRPVSEDQWTRFCPVYRLLALNYPHTGFSRLFVQRLSSVFDSTYTNICYVKAKKEWNVSHKDAGKTVGRGVRCV